MDAEPRSADGNAARCGPWPGTLGSTLHDDPIGHGLAARLPPSRPAPLSRCSARRLRRHADPDRRGRLAGLRDQRQSSRLRARCPIAVPAVPAAHPAGGPRRRPVRPTPRAARDLHRARRLRRRTAHRDARRKREHGADPGAHGPVRDRSRLQHADRAGAAAEPRATRNVRAGSRRELVARPDRHDRRPRAGRCPRAVRRPGRVRRRAAPADHRRGPRRRPRGRRSPGGDRAGARVMGHAAVGAHVRPLAADRAGLHLTRPRRGPLRRGGGAAADLRGRDPGCRPRRPRGDARRACGRCGPPRTGPDGPADPARRRPVAVRGRGRLRCGDHRVRGIHELRREPRGTGRHGRRGHGQHVYPPPAGAAGDA